MSLLDIFMDNHWYLKSKYLLPTNVHLRRQWLHEVDFQKKICAPRQRSEHKSLKQLKNREKTWIASSLVGVTITHSGWRQPSRGLRKIIWGLKTRGLKKSVENMIFERESGGFSPIDRVCAEYRKIFPQNSKQIFAFTYWHSLCRIFRNICAEYLKIFAFTYLHSLWGGCAGWEGERRQFCQSLKTNIICIEVYERSILRNVTNKEH